jgi:hypothetical protein
VSTRHTLLDLLSDAEERKDPARGVESKPGAVVEVQCLQRSSAKMILLPRASKLLDSELTLGRTDDLSL